MNPVNLSEGDTISIDAEAFSGVTFDVRDTDMEDIGITETYAVVLVSDDMDAAWSIVGTTADNTTTISECVEPPLDKSSHRIRHEDITLES